MERIVIHCHCKKGIDEVKMELMEIKDLLSKQRENIVNIPSTSKKTEHEQLDSDFKKAFSTPEITAKLQTCRQVTKVFHDETEESQISQAAPVAEPRQRKT